MVRDTLLLALASAALLLTTGCSSLTRPDDIRILVEATPSPQLPAAGAAGTPPRALPGARAPGG
jgi:hypothetical protein